MYRDIIELKEGLTEREIYEIREICKLCHDNNAGKVEMHELTSTQFVFEGEFKDWETLMIACMTLADTPQFWRNVKMWRWEDEEPDESGDLLADLELSSLIKFNFQEKEIGGVRIV